MQITQKLLIIILISTLVLPPAAYARGVTADRNAGANAPGVDKAANGVPLVNIVKPNASGLSHNKYEKFNVGREGLILNNRGKEGNTQLGGIVGPNPNLVKSGPARAILNEVTGASRSQIQGYIEVAGQKADVILSNPQGITINGGGFINTDRATVTTGRPQVDSLGALKSFEVRGGDVLIEGAGVNASNLTGFDIVSRAATINAEIHAQDLNVVTGRNSYDPHTGAVTPLAPDGSAPSVSIDSSALGGMYAGRIRLTSTEKGVGVNLDGLVQSTGDLSIDSQGRLVVNAAQGAGDVRIKAAEEITVKKAAAAGRGLDVRGRSLSTGQEAALVADKEITIAVDADVRLGRQSLITAPEQVTVSARDMSLEQGAGIQGAGIELDATRDLRLEGATLIADHRLGIRTGSLSSIGSEIAASQLSLRAERDASFLQGKSLITGLVDISTGGDMLFGQNAQVQSQELRLAAGKSLLLDGGTLLASGNANVTSVGLSLTNSAHLQGNSITMALAGDMLANASNLVSIEALNFSSASMRLGNDARVQGKSVSGRISGNASLSGDSVLLSSGHMNLYASGLTLDTGAHLQGDSVTANVTGNVGLSGATLLSSGAFSVESSGLTLADGSQLQAGSFDAALSNAFVLDRASLVSKGFTYVRASDLTLRGSQLQAGELQAQLNGSAVLTDESLMLSSGPLRLNALFLAMSGGSHAQASTMALRISNGVTLDDATLLTSGNVQLTASNLELKNGAHMQAATLEADLGGNLSMNDATLLVAGLMGLKASGLLMSNGGQMQADSLNATLGGRLSLDDATLVAKKDATYTASAMALENGSVLQGGSLKVQLAEGASLSGGSGLIASGALNLNAAKLSAKSGSHVQAVDMNAVIRDSVDFNNATLLATGAVDLKASEMRLANKTGMQAGSLQTSLDGSLRLDDATLVSGSDLTLKADNLALTNGAVMQGGLLNADLTGGASLAGESLLLSSGPLRLTGLFLALSGESHIQADVVNANLSQSMTLDNASLLASGAMYLNASELSLTNKGQMQTGSLEAVLSENLLLDDASLLVKNATDLKATLMSLRNNAALQSGTFGATLGGATLITGNSALISAGDLSLGSTALTLNTGAHLQGVDVTLTLRDGFLLDDATLLASEVMLLNASSMGLANKAQMQAGSLTANLLGGLTLDDATLVAKNHFGLTGSLLSLDSAAMLQAGSLNAQLTGAAALTGQSTLLTTGTMTLGASRLTMNDGAHLQGGNLEVTTPGAIRLSDATMMASGHTALQAASLDADDQARIQSATLQAVIDDDVTINDALLITTSDLGVQAANLRLDNSGLLQGGDTTVILSGIAAVNAAYITATGDLTFSANSLTLKDVSEAGGANVDLQLTGPLEVVESTLYAQGNFDASTSLFSNTNGKLFVDGNMTLKAAIVRLAGDAVPEDFNKSDSGFDLWKHKGVMYAGGNLGLSGDSVVLAAGFIGSGRNLNVTGRDELGLSASAVLHSGGNMTLVTQTPLSLNDNILTANGFLDLTAQSLSLENAEIYSGGYTKANLAGTVLVDANSAIYGMSGLELSASELKNRGLLFSGDGMGLYVSDLLENTSDILAVGSILMRGRNEGQRTARILNDRSTIESLDGDLGLYADVFENYGGEVTTERMDLGRDYAQVGFIGEDELWKIFYTSNQLPHLDIFRNDIALALGTENPAFFDWEGLFSVESFFNRLYALAKPDENGQINIRSLQTQAENLASQSDSVLRQIALVRGQGFTPEGTRNKILKKNQHDTVVLKSNRQAVLDYLLEQERLYGLPALHVFDSESLQEWTYYQQDKLVSGATPAYLMAAGNMVIETGTLTNTHSTISSGGDMTIKAEVLKNIGTELSTHSDVTRHFIQRGHGDRIEGVHEVKHTASWVTDYIPSVITAGRHMELEVTESFENKGIKSGADYVGQSAGTPTFDGFHVTGAGVYGNAKREVESLRDGGAPGSLERQLFELENVLREALGLPTLRELLDQTTPLEAINQTGQTPASVDPTGPTAQIQQPALNFKLPELGKLFSLSENPDHNYIIETNPKLTQLGHFYGSDYFLERVGYDLAREQVKLLGDSFYETRLIREQLLAQSGQRFIFDGVTDDAETMHRLMDNAADEHQSLGLSVGVALSPEQAANLTKDIVWLVSTQVNGQTVLVPRLYLCEATRAELTVRGASITADSMNINAEGFNNSGMIRANDLRIASASDIINRGGLISGKDALFVQSDGSIINRSGSITGGDVNLVAARDIRNETLIEHTTEGRFTTAFANQVGEIKATGDLTLKAGRDITFSGAFADAGGKALLLAEKDVILDAQEATFARTGSDHRYQLTGQAVSGISAGDDLGIKAGQNILLMGSGLEAGNNLSLVAGESVTSLAVEGDYHSYSKITSSQGWGRKQKTVVQHDETRAMGSVISAGNDLRIDAKDVTLQATYAQAGNDALVTAERNITMVDATSSRSDQYYESQTGFGGLSGQSEAKGKAQDTAELSWMAAGGNVTMVAGENIGLVGGQILAGKDVDLNAGYLVQDDGSLARSGKDGSVSLMASHELSGSYHEKKEYNLVSGFKVDFSDGKLFVGVTGEGKKERFERDADTIVGSSITAGGNVNINATNNITLEGADVQAGNNVSFTADNDISILSAKDLESTLHSKEKTEYEMGIRIGNAYVDAAYAVREVVEKASDIVDAKKELDRIERLHAEGRATEQAVNDARLNLAMALVNQGTAAMGAASAIDAAAEAATAAVAGSAMAGSGFYASIGGSVTTKKTETKTDTGISKGSDIQAGGNISFDAGGSMVQTGSRVISHTGDIEYTVADDLLLNAGDNTYSSNTKSSTSTAGFWVGTNGTSVTGVSGNVGGGKSKSSTNDLTWTSGYTQADQGTIRFDVGNDMRAEGYTAVGKHIDVNVGGDLDLISKQNSHTSSGKGWNVSAGLGTGSISGGFGKNKSSEDRLWTDDISGFVGSESVNVDVGGKLHMEGSIIANIKQDGSDGGNLKVAANELTFKDLDDYSKKSEHGFGISISTGNPLGENNNHPEGETTISATRKGHELTGVTHATIGKGDITLRDGTNPDELGINRDIENIQEITSDKVTGALDFEVTVDNRIFTPGGWASIGEDFVNTPENITKIAKVLAHVPPEKQEIILDSMNLDAKAKEAILRQTKLETHTGGTTMTVQEALERNPALADEDFIPKAAAAQAGFVVGGVGWLSGDIIPDGKILEAIIDVYGPEYVSQMQEAYKEGKITGEVGTALATGGIAMKLLKSALSAKRAYAGDKSVGELFKNGKTPRASELKQYAEAQGWKPVQSEGGPLKYVDQNGISRITIKQGSSRAPGSNAPHVEFKNSTGQRTDPFGTPVTRKSPDNHTPIDFDM